MWDSMPGIDSKPNPPRVGSQREKGQTLVEFAFMAVLFFTILFGILEFSRALWTWNTIVQATRAGARFAVVETPTADDAQVKNFVVYHNAAGTGAPVLPGLSTSNVSVNYYKINPSTGAYEAPPGNNKYQADLLQLSITGYTFNFVVPLFGSGITLPAFTTTLSLEGLGAS
ncbi:MAG: TadE/TadG family type IV pilus assembly protein [Acidobacteriota bacterium]